MLQLIVNEFDVIFQMAQEQQICKRKAVGCAIVEPRKDDIINWCHTTNSGGTLCTNEKGGCGCPHAEPRAILQLIKAFGWDTLKNHPLLMLCTFSPCTNCAHIIVESDIIDGVIYDILTMHDIRGTQILEKHKIPTIEKSLLKDHLVGKGSDPLDFLRTKINARRIGN